MMPNDPLHPHVFRGTTAATAKANFVPIDAWQQHFEEPEVPAEPMNYATMVGYLADSLGIGSVEYSQLTARCRKLLKGERGKHSPWPPIAASSGKQGVPASFSRRDLLMFHIVLKLNLGGVPPHLAIPAARRALSALENGGIGIVVEIPAVLGSGSIVVLANVPDGLRAALSKARGEQPA